MATLVYFHKKGSPALNSSMRKFFDFFLSDPKPSMKTDRSEGIIDRFRSWLENAGGKHTACKHATSCANSAATTGARAFALAYSFKAVLGAIGALRRSPRSVPRALVNTGHLRFGAFAGLVFGGTKALECLITRLRGQQDDFTAPLAAAISGLAIRLSGSHEVTMYMVSKAIETLYLHLGEKGLVPVFYHGDVLLFAVSCGILFHAGVMEPHLLRKSYWSFLTSITKGRALQINREAMEPLLPAADIAEIHSLLNATLRTR
eukprot:Colp12_sorted_trinity150504_noHs@33773